MKVKQLFDVDHNPHHLPASARGIRIPGAFDTFETAVSIILGQLISTEQAKQKVKALIVKYGERIEDDVYAFPTPEKLIKSEIEEIGITKVKANAIRELSRLVMEGELDLSPSADLTEMRKKLIAIKGVGPWTVEIIAMRCLGDSDAFPKTDLAIARATYKEANWSTFRGYLTHVLWRDYMKTKDKK